MKLETFFEKFDLFAEAPGAVGKLRELVLSLAVQGKLVPQDSSDPPASELLKEIEAEKKRLVKEGKIKQPKSLLPMTNEEKPYTLPVRWEWVRLQELLAIVTDGDHQPPPKADKGIPFLVIGNLNTGKIAFDGCRFVPASYYEALDWGRKPTSGDILYTVTGSFGITIPVVIDAKFCVQRHVAIFKAVSSTPAAYLVHYLRSSGAFAYAKTIATGIAQKTVPLSGLRDMPIALPPLAEQLRIVAKVDELMTVCDRLEAQLHERQTQHAMLARAALTRFAEAPTPANLELLFHESFAIAPADLRKSILTLAVQGKLVPQDPEDEPAKNIVTRIADSLPNRKSENPFLSRIEASITSESEYELPHGWAWIPLGHLGLWATGCGFPTQYQGETDKEFLFCKVSDMNLPGNEVEIRSTVNSIDAEIMQKIRARANPPGTVIFPKIGGAIATHKRRLVIRPTIIDNNCSGIRPIGLTDDGWLLLLLRNLDLTKYQSGTSVPAVSQGSLDPIRIGLPSLAEQRRIVAKVDELMTLVDALESQLATARDRAAALLAAAVAELKLTSGGNSSPLHLSEGERHGNIT